MVATYSAIECNVSIMCCCMPAFYSFLQRAWPETFGSGSRSQNYKRGSYNLAKSPKPSGIQKMVEQQVSYIPRAGDSDVVELMDIEESRQKVDSYGRW